MALPSLFKQLAGITNFHLSFTLVVDINTTTTTIEVKEIRKSLLVSNIVESDPL